jgi:hypothetical protein
MALSDAARRKFARAVEGMRRGRVASRDASADLLARISGAGLVVSEAEPDLEAMATVLKNAGDQVVPPNG